MKKLATWSFWEKKKKLNKHEKYLSINLIYFQYFFLNLLSRSMWSAFFDQLFKHLVFFKHCRIWLSNQVLHTYQELASSWLHLRSSTQHLVRKWQEADEQATLGKGVVATVDTRQSGKPWDLDFIPVTPGQMSSIGWDWVLDLTVRGEPPGPSHSSLPLSSLQPWAQQPWPAGLAGYWGLREDFWKLCSLCNMKTHSRIIEMFMMWLTTIFLLLTWLNWIHRGLRWDLFTKSRIENLCRRCSPWEVHKEVTQQAANWE